MRAATLPRFGTVALGTVALGTVALGTVALGTVALGTVALGTVALGAVALGTVALGALPRLVGPIAGSPKRLASTTILSERLDLGEAAS